MLEKLVIKIIGSGSLVEGLAQWLDMCTTRGTLPTLGGKRSFIEVLKSGLAVYLFEESVIFSQPYQLTMQNKIRKGTI